MVDIGKSLKRPPACKLLNIFSLRKDRKEPCLEYSPSLLPTFANNSANLSTLKTMVTHSALKKDPENPWRKYNLQKTDFFKHIFRSYQIFWM